MCAVGCAVPRNLVTASSFADSIDFNTASKSTTMYRSASLHTRLLTLVWNATSKEAHYTLLEYAGTWGETMTQTDLKAPTRPTNTLARHYFKKLKKSEWILSSLSAKFDPPKVLYAFTTNPRKEMRTYVIKKVYIYIQERKKERKKNKGFRLMLLYILFFSFVIVSQRP